MRVIHAGVDLELGRRQERCLLGLLVLEAGRVVSTDRLVSLLWNDAPPQSARATLHSYVARLRGRLTPYDIRVVTRGPGYVAEVDPETVDVHRFSALVLLAQNEADPRERAAQLKEALAPVAGPAVGRRRRRSVAPSSGYPAGRRNA
jgi:DNA-binding SARP family transcriptional activator